MQMFTYYKFKLCRIDLVFYICLYVDNKMRNGFIVQNDGDSGTMIWKEPEAREKQATQIGTSACGATAVINTLVHKTR